CSGLLRLWPGWRGGRHLDLDLIADDADGITADFDARVVRPGAVRDAEPPRVPGTGDDAILHVAATERGPHVRAHVIDGVELSALAEDGDQLVADTNRRCLALGHVADPADRMKFPHSSPRQ